MVCENCSLYVLVSLLDEFDCEQYNQSSASADPYVNPEEWQWKKKKPSNDSHSSRVPPSFRRSRKNSIITSRKLIISVHSFNLQVKYSKQKTNAINIKGKRLEKIFPSEFREKLQNFRKEKFVVKSFSLRHINYQELCGIGITQDNFISILRCKKILRKKESFQSNRPFRIE